MQDIIDPAREIRTALAAIPKNELAVVARKAGARANRLHKVAACVGIGSGSVVVVALGGLVVGALLPLAPIIVPALAITMVASVFGGLPASVVIDVMGSKAEKQQKEAIAERDSRLADAARTALAGAIQGGTIRAGLDLRIEREGEIVKQVRVEDMKAIVDSDGRKKLSISALILEDNGKSIDWLNGDSSRVSFEQSVAAFPKAVLDFIRGETLSPDPARTLEPEPPMVQEPEKKLPRITL